MPVLPALQPILDAAASAPPPPAGASVAEIRAAVHAGMEMSMMALGVTRPPLDEVDHRVPVDGGEIVVRVYTPEGDGPFPGYVYFHGGGFWIGTLEHFDSECRGIAADAGCVIASVDYRLAPEAKFPVPVEDCYAAFLWTVEHAAELNIDTDRLVVGGASAGGNLAAAVALMARDRSGPPIVLQVLEIPVTDLTMSQPSVKENGVGYLLTEEGMIDFTAKYLADPADATNPYASPLLADDLTGLPPALVMTMEHDPLRDEGEAYARRLAEAGVPVEHTRWDGHFHGSTTMAVVVPDEAAAYHQAVVDALKRAF